MCCACGLILKLFDPVRSRKSWRTGRWKLITLPLLGFKCFGFPSSYPQPVLSPIWACWRWDAEQNTISASRLQDVHKWKTMDSTKFKAWVPWFLDSCWDSRRQVLWRPPLTFWCHLLGFCQSWSSLHLKSVWCQNSCSCSYPYFIIFYPDLPGVSLK